MTTESTVVNGTSTASCNTNNVEAESTEGNDTTVNGSKQVYTKETTTAYPAI